MSKGMQKIELPEIVSADATIISLPPLITQSASDLKEVSTNGTGSYKETRSQELSYINANAQISPSQVTGTALIATNNLSDVQDLFRSAVNIGLSNSVMYITASANLTSPLSRRIGFNITSSGQTLRLPDATTLNVNSLSSPYLLDNYSSFDVTLLAGDGSTLQTISAGTKYWYSCDSNSSIAGQWYLWPWLGSVNGSSKYSSIIDLNSAYAQTTGQNFTINSGLNLLGGSLNIGGPSTSSNALLDLNSTTKGFSPSRMTTAEMNDIPVTIADAGLIVYVTDLINGLYCFDGATWTYLENSGGGSGSLQAAYTGGNTISLSSGRPVIFSTQTAATNFAIFSPSFTSRTYDNIEGVQFTVSSNGFVTALQYVNVNFSSGARQVGIYRVSDQALLVADLVYKSDPLDSTGNYRTHTIDPIPLVTGETYIVIAVVPANEQWLFYAPMTAPPPFTYTGIVYDIPSSILIYPPSVISGVAVYGNASLQYSVSQSILNINDGTATSMLNIQSTKQGFSPPVWTSTQEDSNILSLGSGDIGLSWYNSTINVPTYWDGLDKQPLLAINKVIQGANMLITPNVDGSLTFASTGGGSSPSVQVQGSFTVYQNTTVWSPALNAFAAVSIDPTTFNPINQVGTSVTTANIDSVTTPIIQNTSTGGTRYCKVTFDLSINPSNTVAQTYTFCITIRRSGGSRVLTNFVQSIKIAGVGTVNGIKPISISGLVDLNTNDYCYVTVSSDSPAQPISAYYFNAELVDTTVASLPSTDSLMQGSSNFYLSQNGGVTYQYMSGSAVIGNIPKFSSVGGQFSDSGFTYTNSNTPSTLVSRDSSGNFSAGTITAALTGNATTSTTATNTTNVATTQVSNNALYPILMVPSTTNSNQGINLTNGLTYNPASSTLQTSSIYVTGTSQALMFINQGQIEGKNITGSFETALIPRWTDNALYLSGGSGGMHLRANNTTDAIVIDSSENVTISSGNLNVSNLTASQAVVTDSSKNLASLAYTSANTASTLVERDGSGNFSAGTITATLTGTATTATNANNVATTQVSNNASYFPIMVASNANSNQAPCLSTAWSFDPFSSSLLTSNIEASVSLQVGTGTNNAPLTVQGAGGTTYAASKVAYFGSGLSSTDANIYQIAIDKNGVNSLLLGINKNTDTDQIKAEAIFISTYTSTGVLQLGRGAGTGLPSTSDLSITATGSINISSLSASSLVGTDGSKNLISISTYGITSLVTVSSSSQAMAFNTRYINNYSGGQCAYALPAATGSGKLIDLQSLNTASTSGWKVTANGTNQIQFGASLSAAGGTLASTVGSATDCATFCDVATGLWSVYPALGANLIVT